MLNPEQCSYSIIMSTEIIGLSHKEREIIANIVKYNTMVFDADDALWSFDKKDYLTIAKLTAILRLSNALDRGHRQKFKDIDVNVENNKLVITAHTFEDITLEKSYFMERVDFFEEVYGLKPVIRRKR
jgi:exopolyphosphatase/guanosine-5'-triphosphate,3'-diphosphate pyrophosphatase